MQKKITQSDWRERAYRFMRWMSFSPNGHGFRKIPENSTQMSIVEHCLVKAGDMKPHKYEKKRTPRRRLFHV